MAWVVVIVALAVAGLAVLAVLGLRLWRQVQVLGREVRAAGERIRTATAAGNELGGRPDPRLTGSSVGPTDVR